MRGFIPLNLFVGLVLVGANPDLLLALENSCSETPNYREHGAHIVLTIWRLLQPENIMLLTPSSRHIKLIDFGLSRRLEKNHVVKEMMGTPEFVGTCACAKASLCAAQIFVHAQFIRCTRAGSCACTRLRTRIFASTRCSMSTQVFTKAQLFVDAQLFVKFQFSQVDTLPV